MQKIKILRITTVPVSLAILLKGQLKFLSENGYEVHAASSDGREVDDLYKNEGRIMHHILPMKRSVNLVSDLFALIRLYMLLRKLRPQIIHSNTPKAGLLAMLAGCLAATPIRIHTFTGLIFPYKTGAFQKLLILMDKITCLCATRIYPEGEGVKKDLKKYNITDKPLKVIANGNLNGIDLDYFSPGIIPIEQQHCLRRHLNIAENDFVYIFVGRLVGDKGINELIESFRQLSSAEKNVKLILVGLPETDLDPLSPSALAEIGRNDNIMAVGFQSDVRPYFSIADVLVFPSYREGFPNVVLQAGAMGLPSIVTDISGSNEIIVNKRNGIIIPVKDVNAICEAMKLLKDDTILRSHLIKEARPLIESRYDQRVVWKAILSEYKALEKENGLI